LVKIGFAMLAATTLALAAQAAGAQGVVTMICADQPGAPVRHYLVISYDRSAVSFSDNPVAFPAQISLNEIVWQVPRAELPNGEVRFAARYTLDRATGKLRSELQCLPRRQTSADPSFCGPETVEYCRARPF
jgi:hypothetical protein